MTTPDPSQNTSKLIPKLSTPLPEAETDEAILTALANVNASLAVVLAAIADLKAEMHRNPTPDDKPPDPDWDGTL
jgi:hypothetical protein